MDISVRHLNNRMALQVPAELPLGLVFIVGRVRNLRESETGAGEAVEQVSFELVDGEHRLRCTLPQSVVHETLLQAGDRVRVSGQLAFDSHAVRYHLFASDLEILSDRSATTPPHDLLADAQERAREADVVPAELPPWVRQLAPPEVQLELGLVDELPEPQGSQVEDDSEIWEESVSAAPSQMPEEMLAFLSGVIDSDEDTELTPEMIAQYLPQKESPARRAEESAPGKAPASRAKEPQSSARRKERSLPDTGQATQVHPGAVGAATPMEATFLELLTLSRAAAEWLWRFRFYIALTFLILSLTAATVILVLLLRGWSLF